MRFLFVFQFEFMGVPAGSVSRVIGFQTETLPKPVISHQRCDATSRDSIRRRGVRGNAGLRAPATPS